MPASSLLGKLKDSAQKLGKRVASMGGLFRQLKVSMIKNFSQEERLQHLCDKQKTLYRRLYSVLIEIEGRRGHVCMTTAPESTGSEEDSHRSGSDSDCVLRYQVERILEALDDTAKAPKTLWEDHCCDPLELPFSDDNSRKLDRLRLEIRRLESAKQLCFAADHDKHPVVKDMTAFGIMTQERQQQRKSEAVRITGKEPIKFSISKR